MTYFVPQLDGSKHQGDNCGPASIAMALRWSTAHKVAPTPSEVRRAMGDPIGGTNIVDWPKGYDAFADDAKAEGFILREAKYQPGRSWEDLLGVLADGGAMCLVIDYSRVPDHLKGDRKFDGYHAVFVSRVRERGTATELRVWDPLCDGRRAGIPRGPLWYPKLTLKAAAAGYAGAGKAAYMRVVKATEIAPDPCGSSTRRINALEAALESARSRLLDPSQDVASVIADIDELIAPPETDPTATAGEGIV